MLDASRYCEAAARIVAEDGADGVALLMADHERQLHKLRDIYDLTGVGLDVPLTEEEFAERLSKIRALALDGLKMPMALKIKLGADPMVVDLGEVRLQYTPPADEVVAGVKSHDHEWTEPRSHVGAASSAVPEQSIAVQFCSDPTCLALRIGQGDDPPVTFGPRLTPPVYPTVAGKCPACELQVLFLGAGGLVTCSNIDCPQPDAAAKRIVGLPTDAELAERMKLLERIAGLEESLDVVRGRAGRLGAAGATLVRHLKHEGPAWWVEAAAALSQIEGIVFHHEAEAAEAPREKR